MKKVLGLLAIVGFVACSGENKEAAEAAAKATADSTAAANAAKATADSLAANTAKAMDTAKAAMDTAKAAMKTAEAPKH